MRSHLYVERLNPLGHTVVMSASTEILIRLHRRVYVPEYGMADGFLAGVRQTLHAAAAYGWPSGAGAGWLIDHGDGLSGSLGLTDEGDGVGKVRWFVLASELRGHGLGRRMFSELLDHAVARGLRRLELETFSELRAAGHLYRDAGFRVTWDRPRDDWGAPIVYQHYELDL
jgi:ribosomal protein S18 acetylase RimI-like enzyme